MYSTALSNIAAGPAESAESTDTLKLCPHEEFLTMSKEKAGEVLYCALYMK